MIHKSYKDPNVVMMAAINRVKWITYSDDIPRIAVGNSPLHHLLLFNTGTVEKTKDIPYGKHSCSSCWRQNN